MPASTPLRAPKPDSAPLGGGSSLDVGAHWDVCASTRLDRPAAVRHPPRFARLNPTPRRLGAARVWTPVRIGTFIFPYDLTGQPQCGIHFIGAGQVSDTPRVLRRAARRFRDTAHCHVGRTQARVDWPHCAEPCGAPRVVMAHDPSYSHIISRTVGNCMVFLCKIPLIFYWTREAVIWFQKRRGDWAFSSFRWRC